MMQIMARPCFKTSGFGCTANFDLASLYLWYCISGIISLVLYCISGVWWTIFKCKVCESKLKIDQRSCPFGE